MATAQFPRPSWYKPEEDSWSKVKEAFRRDWQQTEHDFGARVPNLNQQVGDTVSQASGSKPIPPANVPTPHPESTAYRDEDEPAYRYGYAAYHHYSNKNSDQDSFEDSESTIRGDWSDQTEWERQQSAIRHGWNYGRLERLRNRPK